MRYHQEPLDFTLQQAFFSQAIGAKIQSGKATLLILPFRPQPAIGQQALADLGIGEVSDDDMLKAARIAFNLGLLYPPIAPIGIGCAFALHQEFHAKAPRFGTGIVSNIGISRFDDLRRPHWLRCGYPNRSAFLSYWEQATADLPPRANPWCWLIEFTYRG